MSIDPKAESFYYISPYTYCAGDPVNLVDPDGEKIEVITNGEIHLWREYNGECFFYNKDNELYIGDDEFVNKASAALTHLMKYSSTGFELVEYLSNHISEIRLLNTPKSCWQKGKLGWNINNPEAVPTTEGLQANAIVNLGHELAHAQYEFAGGEKGTWFEYINKEGKIEEVKKSDIYTTHYENKIRSEMGLPLRTHYAILPEGSDLTSAIINPETGRSLYFINEWGTNNTELPSNVLGYAYY